jgi:hypothetical protein
MTHSAVEVQRIKSTVGSDFVKEDELELVELYRRGNSLPQRIIPKLARRGFAGGA